LRAFLFSRQGKRYSNIRKLIASFDGEITSIYRHFGHLSLASQQKAGEIIKNHYNLILKNKSWNYHFIHKSNTITLLHKLTEESTKEKDLPSLHHLTLQRILNSLQNMQIARKGMVAIHQEKIPFFEWILIYFLAFILLISLSLIPSQGYLLASILKASFFTAVISVLILLYEFDSLKFFENTIGEHSAQDILDIIAGKK